MIGGGQLGAALARQAGLQGRVVVASRAERAHAGWWLHFDAARDPVDALVRRVGARQVVLAIGPVEAPLLADLVEKAGRHAAVTVCVPLGLEPGPAHRVVALGPLFGTQDHCLAPLLPTLRAGGTARHPRGLPDSRPLYAEDAARAVLRLMATPGQAELVGPDLRAFSELTGVLVRRFGGRCAPRWLGGGLRECYREAMRRSAAVTDAWDDATLGARRGFDDWVERLPGPRPKR